MGMSDRNRGIIMQDAGRWSWSWLLFDVTQIMNREAVSEKDGSARIPVCRVVRNWLFSAPVGVHECRSGIRGLRAVSPGIARHPRHGRLRDYPAPSSP